MEKSRIRDKHPGSATLQRIKCAKKKKTEGSVAVSFKKGVEFFQRYIRYSSLTDTVEERLKNKTCVQKLIRMAFYNI
jgi:hypothetical protein